MGAHDRPPLLDLDHGDRDMQRALSNEIEVNRQLRREAEERDGRDHLILRLLGYVTRDDDAQSMWAAIHHVRLLLGQPGRPDPTLVRRLLAELGGDR